MSNCFQVSVIKNDANNSHNNKYRYSPLLPGNGNIRLLRLMAAAGDDDKNTTVECQLFDYPLQKLGEGTHLYEALSYAWGDSNNLRPILINRHKFLITRNLYSALLHLRNRFLDRILWVDALCIYQNDNQEKGQQILLMAEIYSKAIRVIVWLGVTEKDSDQALETIHLAADNATTEPIEIKFAQASETIQLAAGNTSAEPLVDELNKQAILTLLKRPWFKRIWVRVLVFNPIHIHSLTRLIQVLQEVAAARNILIKCGSTEIDGYAFCTAIHSKAFAFLSEYPELQSLIRTVTYLITGAAFRRKKVSRPSGTVSLHIRPLGELIEMYHNHEAKKHHDKVFALLGMSSDDLSSAGLLPDYEIPWEVLLKRVVKFILGGQVSVKTWAETEMAEIKSRGCVLGRVSSVRRAVTWDGRQGVTITWNDTWRQLGHSDKWGRKWTLQTSVKSIMKGDVICLLRGALKPTIIRLHKDRSTILQLTTTPQQSAQNESEFFEWPNDRQLINLLPTLDFQLIWDWENYPEKFQGFGKFEELENSLDKASRLWNFALLLSTAEQHENAEVKFQEALKSYEIAFEEGYLRTEADLRNAGDIGLGHSVYGRTALSWAAQGGHIAMVDLLLRMSDEYTNFSDVKDWTPLFWAVVGGHLAVVDRLLQEEVDINKQAQGGEIVLHKAVKEGNIAIVKRLLQEKKININLRGEFGGQIALNLLVQGSHLAFIERLLKEGNIDISTGGISGDTVLHIAAKEGHFAIVERILQEKVNINARGGTWETALHKAAKRGHLAIIERILEERADINIPGLFEDTPLYAAAKEGHLAVVECLLQAKADTKPRQILGKTALYAAAKKGHLAVVEQLLQAKADVNEKTSTGETALYVAAEKGFLEIVERLLQAKADVNKVTDVGETALRAAEANGHSEVANRLLEAGAKW